MSDVLFKQVVTEDELRGKGGDKGRKAFKLQAVVNQIYVVLSINGFFTEGRL